MAFIQEKADPMQAALLIFFGRQSGVRYQLVQHDIQNFQLFFAQAGRYFYVAAVDKTHGA